MVTTQPRDSENVGSNADKKNSLKIVFVGKSINEKVFLAKLFYAFMGKDYDCKWVLGTEWAIFN